MMLRAIVLAASALVLSGCASIVSGSHQSVSIDSQPQGAPVAVDSLHRGSTPLEVELRRGESHEIVFHKPGYEEETLMTTTSMNGWAFGNVVFLVAAVIGVLVDGYTGAISNVVPDPVIVTLQRETVAAEDAPEPADRPHPAPRRPRWMVPEADAGDPGDLDVSPRRDGQ